MTSGQASSLSDSGAELAPCSCPVPNVDSTLSAPSEPPPELDPVPGAPPENGAEPLAAAYAAPLSEPQPEDIRESTWSEMRPRAALIARTLHLDARGRALLREILTDPDSDRRMRAAQIADAVGVARDETDRFHRLVQAIPDEVPENLLDSIGGPQMIPPELQVNSAGKQVGLASQAWAFFIRARMSEILTPDQFDRFCRVQEKLFPMYEEDGGSNE